MILSHRTQLGPPHVYCVARHALANSQNVSDRSQFARKTGVFARRCCLGVASDERITCAMLPDVLIARAAIALPAGAVSVVFCVTIKQPTPLEIGCDLVTLALFNTDNALPKIGCAVANVYLRSGAPILKRLM
jgi:hypothetical protein